MTEGKPLIWVLLGSRPGDNNQALALAEELGLPFETKQLSYAKFGGYDLGRIKPSRLGASLLSLDKAAKAGIRPPWPDLVIGVGRRSVPVARYIRKKSGGRTKLVRVGNPRVDPKLFDLVITTPQYPVPPADNVLLLPLAMSRFAKPPEPADEEAAFLKQMGQFRLFAIGGPTRFWGLPEEALVKHLAKAEFLTNRTPYSVVVATSRRTPPGLVQRIREMARGSPHMAVVDGPTPRFAVLLNAADQIFVTGDSVSMISEAVLTGKAVAIIPIEQDEEGLLELGPTPRERGSDADRRDLRRFWNYLIEQGMVGTIDDYPKAAATIPNPNAIAAEAVRKLLGDAD